jgi:chemotaxis protein methyltransferase WspC
MSTVKFGTLLKSSIGLDAGAIGISAIDRAVLERQRACGIPGWAAYWDHVRSSEAELQALIEAVVVSETWFFRDRGAFGALADYVGCEWRPAHPDVVLRVLSLPCASGEEPYSIAMTLLDAGLTPERFRVDAVDISDRALAHARYGVYGKGSFRGTDLAFRDRYFEPVEGGHRIVDAVRQQVTFQRGNLCGADLLPGVELYDVVFCRNVMIYFDRATQNLAVEQVSRLLTPTGLLFVGPAETGVSLDRHFVPAQVPMAFAFRKRSTAVRDARPRSAGTRAHGGAAAAPAPPSVDSRSRTLPQTTASTFEEKPAPPAATAQRDAGCELAEAIRLADEGRFAEAALVCERHLRSHGPSAAAFYLLGLVCDATGELTEAVSCYRKALYLDPAHQEALVHLALLMEAQNCDAEARVLRNRARRLAASSGMAT